MTSLLIVLFMFIHNTVVQSRILRQYVQQRINCSRIALALALSVGEFLQFCRAFNSISPGQISIQS